MGRHLVAHQRHADEIGHLLLVEQAQRLARVPFGHQHQLAPDGDGLEEDRNLARDVEQRHRDQRARLHGRRIAALGQQLQHHRGLADIVHRARHDAEMVGIGALGITGRAGRIQDRRQIVRSQLAEHFLGGVAIAQDRGETFLAMVEDDDLRLVIDPVEPGGARRIGEDQRTFAQLDPVGEFLARPPAIEQRGAAARHQRAHIGDRPLGRIARRDPDPVALFKVVRGRQPVRHLCGHPIDLAEGQALLAIDQKQRILVLVAEMGEIMRQARRRVDEGRHVHAAAGHGLEGEHLPIGGHRIGDPGNVAVEIGLHGLRLSSPKVSEGVTERRAVFRASPGCAKSRPPTRSPGGGFRSIYKG